MKQHYLPLALLAAALPVSSLALNTPRQTGTPFKAMILGDSITHGADGDWTWRYRLWQWMRADVALEPQFVGPFKGTFLDDKNPNTSVDAGGKYHAGTDAAFLSASSHAAYWGRQLAQSKDTIFEWTRDHQPEYLLVMLGFNDLGWFFSDVNGTLASMEAFVAQARAAKPSINFFIANIVDRDFLGGREDLVKNTKEYNERLPALLRQWEKQGSTASFIRHVDVNTIYECKPAGCPDGYDGLHPNEHGEYNIARAFSIAMVAAGYGTTPVVTPPCAAVMPYKCNYSS